MQTWREVDHEVRFFSHMHSVPTMEELVDGEYFIYPQATGFIDRIHSEFSRMRAVRELIFAVSQFHPDLIYLRWSMFVFPVHRLLKVAPTVIEVNTNDFEEHKLLGLLPGLYNRMTRGLLLGRSAGHVYATAEMAELPVFQKYHKPGVVVTNSLDLDHTPYYPAPRNSPPHLLFIGTPGMPWHGEEKLVPLAKSYPDLIIDIMGIDRIDVVSELPDNIRLHGFLSGQDYESVLSQADAAIGTLALHKKGMEEAAPFKIRDCAARGIPCILPYKDTDFDDLQSEFFLRIPNTKDNIQTHGQAIHDFVFSMRGQRIPHELIASRIENSVKESKRLSFFQQMIEK